MQREPDPGRTRPWGRFDDLVAGRAQVFGPVERELVAYQPRDVADVLAAVDAATRAGAWAFGYLAYEAATGLDPGLPAPPAPEADHPPLAWFGLTGPPRDAAPVARPDDTGPTPEAEWTPGWSESTYRAAFTRVRSEIARGTTYQVNLTTALDGPFDSEPLALYSRLAHAQHGHYAAYLDLGRWVIASASPELFFQWRDGQLRTRPMKGTAPRGDTTAEDRDRRRALRASAKERAENVIVVDLLRNDLGRIAETGTVQVEELGRAERYDTVWQLTSTIAARPRPDIGLLDVFRALFPSGSVTGAPKPATMALIAELESPRGVYCGAIGVLAPPTAPERARFSVAIRTAVLDRRRGTGRYGVGSAVTWSSQLAAERAELAAKAAILTPRPSFELLETMRWDPGSGLRNGERHLARLRDSAAYFGFELDLGRVRARLDATGAQADSPRRVRLRLAPDGAVQVELSDLPPVPDRPVRLVIDREPLDGPGPWRRHKTTRREHLWERAARWPQADDVILTNGSGRVTETTIANLAVRIGAQWFTPPTAAGLLAGIERTRLVELGRLVERDLTPDQVARADELAVINSLRGWRSAELIEIAAPARSAEPGQPGWGAAPPT